MLVKNEILVKKRNFSQTKIWSNNQSLVNKLILSKFDRNNRNFGQKLKFLPHIQIYGCQIFDN